MPKRWGDRAWGGRDKRAGVAGCQRGRVGLWERTTNGTGEGKRKLHEAGRDGHRGGKRLPPSRLNSGACHARQVQKWPGHSRQPTVLMLVSCSTLLVPQSSAAPRLPSSFVCKIFPFLRCLQRPNLQQVAHCNSRVSQSESHVATADMLQAASES